MRGRLVVGAGDPLTLGLSGMLSPRFLLVDDDPVVLRTRRRMLGSRCPHWEVYTAESGKAALQQLATRSYDVVVVDWSMPEMDGIELLRIVREKYPGVVRMLCSGLAEGLDDGAPVAHLLHAVLDKAVSTEQFVAALTRALDYKDDVRRDAL